MGIGAKPNFGWKDIYVYMHLKASTFFLFISAFIVASTVVLLLLPYWCSCIILSLVCVTNMADELHDNKLTDSYSDAQVLDICQQHVDVDLFVDETKSPPSLQELSNAIAVNPLSPEQPQASSGITYMQICSIV